KDKSKMSLISKYGKTALVAGASEGLGAAFANHLAAQGMNLVLIARRKEPLQQLADQLTAKYKIEVVCISCDLADPNATQQIQTQLADKEINLLVYNAALSYIGPFEKNTAENNTQMAIANMLTPMNMAYTFGEKMLQKKCGAIILMASLAGFQGSGFLSVYASTKAFNRVLAESLWYEWKNKGIDVMACCAGATATPNFINTKPEKSNFFAPKVQSPEEVVTECFQKLGKQPSFVTGFGNKFASFIMQKLMPRKMAVNIMGDTTKKMYRL
ncbi:MAG TPA: SDR family NAD(P)-dependent oxidoreductase, partial [Bacteroidia bacterium]|nr:SDR family NAD(P)-dependent oxidoreductase [Bacteroidia bacterium]